MVEVVTVTVVAVMVEVVTVTVVAVVVEVVVAVAAKGVERKIGLTQGQKPIVNDFPCLVPSF